MSKDDRLFEIADSQQGYFTAKQAEECGFYASHFSRYVSSGRWIKEQRGIYRLAHYSVTERPELVLWMLWSRSKGGAIQGTWSHETALDIYELSDVMPAKMHMTVPMGFRKSVPIPKLLVLHRAELSASEIRVQQGYRVTTPLRTLQDILAEGSLSREFVVQAIQEALQRGLVSRQDLKKHSDPEVSKEFTRLIDDYHL